MEVECCSSEVNFICHNSAPNPSPGFHTTLKTNTPYISYLSPDGAFGTRTHTWAWLIFRKGIAMVGTEPDPASTAVLRSRGWPMDNTTRTQPGRKAAVANDRTYLQHLPIWVQGLLC